jgi:hypothetical protein
VSTPVVVAIIGAVAIMVPAALTTVNILLVRKLSVRVDGRLTQLLKETARAQHAEGRREGVESGEHGGERK